MSGLRRRRVLDIWPGFVDAIASLLMVVVFVLLMASIGHFFLSDAISGRDETLTRLSEQVQRLNELLAVEQAQTASLGQQLEQTSARLRQTRDSLEESRLQSEQLQALSDQQAEALAQQASQLADLQADIQALEALRARLESEIAEAVAARDEGREQLSRQQAISDRALAQVEMLNQQIEQLREQLATVAAALDLAEQTAHQREQQVEELTERLNLALANEVFRLQSYRSEFFGRLREALADSPDVRIEGDRFILPSELLFETASADLGPQGRGQVRQLAEALKSISARIPDDIDWILRIDGHTDRRPIRTERFPSNWELSSARAISIVQLLNDYGIPADRMAATGFGENHPISQGTTERDHALNRRIEIKLTSR